MTTTVDLLARLARVVAAMAQDTQWHDQMFDLIADIEELQCRGGSEAHPVPPGAGSHPPVYAAEYEDLVKLCEAGLADIAIAMDDDERNANDPG